jgi:L-fucose mutarotase/ribose pyranase (RbsD/FucU family)
MKPADKSKDPKIWSVYKKIIESGDGQKYQWAKLNRQKFYDEAKKVGNMT